MNKLQQCWRWYGPDDSVSLQDIKQAGAKAIVTALHHIPHGEIWSIQEIKIRKDIIEKAGLLWTVVESVPVHEEIKTNGPQAYLFLSNYKETLHNLALAGVTTVCYNFMPVSDWTRTQLDFVMQDGSKALYFNWIDLAIFDIYLLKRETARASYSQELLVEIDRKYESLSIGDKQKLTEVILMGIPGEHNISLEQLNTSIAVYAAIGKEGLRNNLYNFLNAITDTCISNGIKMAIHPDDPPFDILGLPRIVSNVHDFDELLSHVDLDFNGVCFCTGSLAANPENDLPKLLNRIKQRVHFVHLRNIKKDHYGSFYESDHLDGDANMYAIMKILIQENQIRKVPIPFRPDHGHQMLDDLDKVTHPGYSAIGRLRGLAELRGLEYGILGQ